MKMPPQAADELLIPNPQANPTSYLRHLQSGE